MQADGFTSLYVNIRRQSGLEADISPILGLTLVGMIELATIVGAVTGIVASVIVAFTVHRSNKAHLAQRRKVDSAVLVRDLHSPWRNNEKFKTFLSKLNDPKVVKYDDTEMEGLLNRFESIASFWADKTLVDYHVKSLFSANLKAIRTDKCIQDYMKKSRSVNPNCFSYLAKLLERSEEWDA